MNTKKTTMTQPELKEAIEEILNQPVALHKEGKCQFCDYQCKTFAKLNGLARHMITNHQDKYKNKSQKLLDLFNKQLKGGVYMMRQWLNEDRIKDADRFVTNEELLTWFEPLIKSEETE